MGRAGAKRNIRVCGGAGQRRRHNLLGMHAPLRGCRVDSACMDLRQESANGVCAWRVVRATLATALAGVIGETWALAFLQYFDDACRPWKPSLPIYGRTAKAGKAGAEYGLLSA